MTKAQVAEVLTEIATLLELKGENPFKSRAYVNAARAVEAATEPLEKIFCPESETRLKGIGDSLQEKICEFVQTGKLPYYDELKSSIPPGLVTMLGIPGLGPKKIKALHDKLGVETVEQLEQACKDGKVALLDGFGEKTQVKICEGINFRRQYASRHLLSDAVAAAEAILNNLRQHPDVTRCDTAGSLRRSKEIIGDIDFLASSRHPAGVIDFFAAQPGVINITAKGDTKVSVVLEGGIQADLRVVSDPEFPFALAYFTGSKEHNIVMRQRAIQRGLRLNEYGLFRSEVETRDPALLVACRTEEEIFQQLGLAYIPPELREDAGEFAAAEQQALPRLVEWTQLKGSLHNHSNWSDGHSTLAEIADYMQELGCEYWAITDHSKSSVQANGLQPERVRRQLVEIRALNQKLADEGREFRFIPGAEVDILSDGQLDFSDDLLAELEIVVASLHQPFAQSEAEITRRLIRAAENPHVHILGHLTGRLLLEREAYKVNQTAVIDACAATGTWLELNASPHRFDLDWRLWHYAKKKGVKCVINCDAHRNEHAGYLRLGAGIARKGWLEKDDVINTLPLAKLKKELARKRARGAKA
ncbi:MAG TPA: DNA polymerase/3'-5' exonuclease PolX [Verrucomicrobiae bacterium]|jgi:DNA polymerase (family 10)|nr:DNA polymerase/3'-5' exonuclease PolX [Verrucomicrobiae bacterium]